MTTSFLFAGRLCEVPRVMSDGRMGGPTSVVFDGRVAGSASDVFDERVGASSVKFDANMSLASSI